MKSRHLALVATLLFGASGAPAYSEEPAPAANAADTIAPRISQDDLLADMAKSKNVVVLDVRTPAEFAAGHVPGARNVSHDQLEGRLAELSTLRDQEVVVYCRSGRRTALATDILHKAGFTKLRHLDGDYLAWEAQQRPVEKEAAPAK